MDNKTLYGRAGILLAYPVAYLYLRLLVQYIPFFEDEVKWFFPITCTVFTVLFIVWNELVMRSYGKKTRKEAYLWYGTMILTSVTSSIAPSVLLSVFAVHLCAVYCVLVSNGILYENRTGRFILLDLLNGGFVRTFPNMGHLFRDIGKLRNDPSRTPEDRSGRIAGVVMALAAIPVFVIVLALLSSLNDAFAGLVDKFFEILNFNWIFRNIGQTIARLIFAVPISLFLYGLLSSCAGSDGESERRSCDLMKAESERRRKVRSAVGASIIAVFDIIYTLFFVLEGNYLFSGIMGRLPDGYTFSSYARSGFFQLIAIMVINTGIYLAVRLFCRRKDNESSPAVKWMLTVLLLQSVLFSVLSISKIFMYFYVYGYTPKRMLSMWATLVMAAGSVFLIRTLFRRKDMSGIWIYFTSFSYIVICLISGVLDFLF